MSCLLAEQNRGEYFTVYKPNIGRQSQLETLDSLCRRFHRVWKDHPTLPWQLRMCGEAPEPVSLLTWACIPRSPRRRPGSLGRAPMPCRWSTAAIPPGEAWREAGPGAQCPRALWAGKAHAAS